MEAALQKIMEQDQDCYGFTATIQDIAKPALDFDPFASFNPRA